MLLIPGALRRLAQLPTSKALCSHLRVMSGCKLATSRTLWARLHTSSTNNNRTNNIEPHNLYKNILETKNILNQAAPLLPPHEPHKTFYKEFYQLNNYFTHGRHLMHDTLRESGALARTKYFVSAAKTEIVMTSDVGTNTCGHKDVIHGGLTCLLFDNAFATLSFLNSSLAVTKTLDVKFIQPIKCGEPLLLRAAITAVDSDSRGRPALHLQGALYYYSHELINSCDDASWLRDVDAHTTGMKPLAAGHGVLIDVGAAT